MRNTHSDVESAITAIVADAEPEIFIVEITRNPKKPDVLRIVLDGDQGVRLDQCAGINRAIQAHFEAIDPEWDMGIEVCTPGVGNPLKLKRQYKANLGRILVVTQKDGMQFKGILQNTDDDNITLEYIERDPLTKKKITTNRIIAFEQIKEGRIEVRF